MIDEAMKDDLKDAAPAVENRAATGIAELDRVLSGGLVCGSLTLVGGEPGVGKSTLLLQLCQGVRLQPPILYVSGEESLSQIKLRAARLGVKRPGLYIISETALAAIENAVDKLKPSLVIVDSIQTMSDESLQNTPGSPTQIRECAGFLMRLAKSRGISVVLIGHVTKDGTIAGPRMLEHMVDTVLYFEGDKQLLYRIIRAVKNRFGGTNEIGVFEMRGDGLAEISNPSAYMLSGRPKDAPGSVVTCAMEGSRPILSEVQALVCRTSFGMPRRVADGTDYNRVVMLIAILEKRAGLSFANYDCYVNIAGGLSINEPAVDLAAIAALASSYKNKPVPGSMVIFGETGLTGEARAVAQAEKRVYEAARLGFTQCVIPQVNLKGFKPPEGIRVFGAANINEMLEIAFNI
ncbi:MAG: DNA repair protein RadA [Defluviitaleaceae bacterium]|nr:DNA repair protein RadA [Defluviitaleaceae bacterium]